MRRAAGATVVDSFFRGISYSTQVFPASRPSAHGVQRIRNIRYFESDHNDHLLDVYRPDDDRTGLPVVLYVHGGGFRILSKDSHWMMGLAFARRDFVVFNIDYRKFPHAYPAAHEDVCHAYRWVVANAEAFGADPSRIVVTGESAGANLAASLVIATCWERPEPFAREVFDTSVVPKACIPACGILQVSDPRRFSRRRPLPFWLADRIDEVTDAYLGDTRHPGYDLADPVVFYERNEPSDRPLPRFFIPVGTRDPVLDDSRRLGLALQRLGVDAEVRYYPGEVHAFHAFLWRRNARACWAHTFRFLDRALEEP